MIQIKKSHSASDIPTLIQNDKLNKFSITNISDTYSINNNIIFKMYNILNEYRGLLLSDLITVTIPDEEFLIPERTALNYYGSADLWYIILYANGMKDKYEYTRKNVKILSNNSLTLVNSIIEDNMERLKLYRNSPIRVSASNIA